MLKVPWFKITSAILNTFDGSEFLLGYDFDVDKLAMKLSLFLPISQTSLATLETNLQTQLVSSSHSYLEQQMYSNETKVERLNIFESSGKILFIQM